MKRSDLILVPLLEAALILVAGLAGWMAHQPLLFSSLGPTAYEMIETPHRQTARPSNILGGHLIGLLAGYLALLLTHGWQAPAISSAGVPLPRVWAATLATLLTVFGTLLLGVTQPAAISTSLLIASGTLQTPRDAAVIPAAVLLMTAVGEPVRRMRLRGPGRGAAKSAKG